MNGIVNNNHQIIMVGLSNNKITTMVVWASTLQIMMDGETLKIIIADGVNHNLIMMDGRITKGATIVWVIAITKEIKMF